jgi:signal transduction histidine kinase
MRGYATMLLDGDKGDISREVKDILQKIMISGNDVTTLLAEYLDKSKIELGQLEYNPTRFDVKNVINEVLSIFKMYSREIDRKLFFFPYKYDVERFSNRVIGHEMLHFMFFDFLFDRYQLRENSKLEGRPENYIWQLSEAFNSLVENNPLYMESIGIGYSGKPYIGQEGMVTLMGEQFGKEKNIGKLLDKWIIGA